MGIDTELEADVRIGPALLQGMIGLRGSIDSMAKEIEKQRSIEADYERLGPVSVKLRGSEAADSGGDTLLIDIGGPARGRRWEVRSLIVGGPLWTSVVAGSALIVVSGARSATPALPDITDVMAALPAKALYSGGQLVIRWPEHLHIVMLTPTASGLYSAGGFALDLPDLPARRFVGV